MRNTTILVFWIAALAAPAAPVFAAPGDMRIDCAHFQRQADGVWHAGASAGLSVGASRISLSNTVLSAKSMLIDGESLAARLERQCRAPAGQDAAPPSSDSGTSRAGAVTPAQH
jgi:hypothetical protein